MASKFYSINKLYKDACKEISTDIESWQGFLLSAGRNFKLRFDEQVLVYAQRPDATAVVTFEQLVSTSVAYMIMARLGIDINSSFEKADFAAITDFNTKDTLHAIGYAVSDISQMALSEIGKTIRNLQAEKKLNRTFAAPKEGIYNGEKRERRGEHEHRISTERELSDSNDRYAEGRANANRQIRTHEVRLPERTSQINIIQHAH